MISRKFLPAIVLIFILSLLIPVLSQAQTNLPKYKRKVKKEFYNNIVSLDSLFFAAYDHCDMAIMDSLLSDDLEFYHDKGGFSNSKKGTLEAIQKNICGKVTRELLKGSIEVYEIKDFGAIEIGFHGFHNNQEKEPEKTHFSKFIHTWRFNDGKWKLTRIISLH